MKVEKRTDGWWIKSNRPDVEDMGPYATKAEAAEDMQGVVRTLATLDKKEAAKAARKAKRDATT